MKKILLIIITAFLLMGCMDNKASDDTGNRLRPYIDLVLNNNEENYKTNTRNFFVCFKRMYEKKEYGEYIYQVPDVIKQIFKDNSKEQIVKSSKSNQVY